MPRRVCFIAEADVPTRWVLSSTLSSEIMSYTSRTVIDGCRKTETERKKATGRPVAKSQSSELRRCFPEISSVTCGAAFTVTAERAEPRFYSSIARSLLLQLSIHTRANV